ncbi:DUF1127 domain-containing protein [Thiofilum flexile]|uniref:DUF1127 domain-containing protein n=1 Tax=Thiofilum flexile TaxID=125627 RepID=UPI00036E4D6F|nr:DUF1127 domain-containing protein [Thiofilum flexile]
MTILSLITTTVRHGLELIERTYTRQQLLKLNDRVLADLGMSRELLEQGTSAFPWKTAEALEAQVAQVNTAQPEVAVTRKPLETPQAQHGTMTTRHSYV